MSISNRALLLTAIVLGGVPVARTQQNFLPGFAGLKDGTQAPPGMYIAAVGWGLNTSTIVDKSGNSQTLPNGAINSTMVGALVQVVTKAKLLGGYYAFAVMVPWIQNRIDIPLLTASSNSGWGWTSTYVQPLNLGWHTDRADYVLGYAVYLPTGAWTFKGSSNFGLGMWTQEITAGTTLYLNQKKSLSFALEAVYDINSTKKDTTYRTGFPLTLQGGLGIDYGNPKKYFSGWFGAAAFAQWTVKATTYDVSFGPIDKTLTGPYPQKYGVGPEFVTLQGALTIRYLWEFGARSSLQGNIWFVAFGVPL